MIREEILEYLKDLEIIEKLEDRRGNEKIVIRQSGTFIFLYIDPRCEIQLRSEGDADKITFQIEYQVLKKFIEAFLSHCHKSMPRKYISEIVDIIVRLEPNKGFDNGEVYLWINEMQFNREFVMKVLLSLIDLLEKQPIEVSNEEGSEVGINFYGWGFGFL